MLQHHWCNTRRDSASYCNWKKSTRTQSALAFAISQCSVNLINITCANSVNVTQSISISKSKGKAVDFRKFPGFCQKERIFFAHQTKEPVFAKKKHCLQFCKNSRLEKYLFSDHWQKWKLENWVSWQKPFYLSPTRVLPFLQPKNILLDILVNLPMLLFTLLVFSCLKLEILSHTRLNYDTRDFQSLLWKSLQHYCDTQCQIRPVTPQH